MENFTTEQLRNVIKALDIGLRDCINWMSCAEHLASCNMWVDEKIDWDRECSCNLENLKNKYADVNQFQKYWRL